MKKTRIVISIIGIVIISIFLIVLINKNTDKTFIQDGVIFALTLDNETTSNFPDYEKGDYTVIVDCKNAKGFWKQVESIKDGQLVYDWKLVLEDISGKVMCNLDFKTKTDNDKLINIIQAEKNRTNNSGICTIKNYTTKSDCENNKGIWWGVFEENGLRYEGLNPDNYVWFNNELWRIIGYLPTKDEVGNDTNLVKIMRAESIGGFTFNESGSTFVGSRIYNLLNNNYYNRTDGTKSGYCYGYSSEINGSCDYTHIGLNDYARSMVKPVQWAVGMSGITYVDEQYTNEIKTYTNVSNGINVGLISASDYGYGVLDSDCERETTLLNAYNNSSCAGNHWMYGQGFHWTLSPISSAKVGYISYFGNVASNDPIYGYIVRPVVNLEDTVYVVSGSGNILDPYILGI